MDLLWDLINWIESHAGILMLVFIVLIWWTVVRRDVQANVLIGHTFDTQEALKEVNQTLESIFASLEAMRLDVQGLRSDLRVRDR